LWKVDGEGKRVRSVGTPCCFILISTYRFSGSGCTTSSPLWKFGYADDKNYSLGWCDICIVHEVRPPSQRLITALLLLANIYFFINLHHFVIITVFWVQYFHCLASCTLWLATVCFSSSCRISTPRPKPLWYPRSFAEFSPVIYPSLEHSSSSWSIDLPIIVFLRIAEKKPTEKEPRNININMNTILCIRHDTRDILCYKL